jgi:hypothetical protein
MTKPRKEPSSKYVKKKQENKRNDERSLEDRAREYLASGTVGAYVTQVALVLVMLSGAAALGALAPGLSVGAAQWRRSRRYSNKQITDAMGNLRRGGYMEKIIGKDKKPRVVLTKKGEAYLQKILFEDIHLPEPKKWEGSWTFVLFDIPVQFSKERTSFRWRLKNLGFYQYQKSVWVYPHPCEKEILSIADYFGVGKFVEILVTDHLSEDRDMKKYFGLK